MASGGAITGISGEAIRSDSGALNVDVTGTATGVIEARGGGDLDVDVLGSGRISGDVKTTGGGDLDVSVSGSGRIAGDVQSSGTLTLAAAAGSVITGTVHDPAASFSTASGTIGRILYGAGGTVTVASTGVITGVSGEAIRGGAGALDVTIAGMATGAVRSGGALDLDVSGTLTGGARGAGDLEAIVSGTVSGDLRGGGVLTATVSGSVGGDLEGLGTGAHTLTVSAGGAVTGGVRAGGNLEAPVSGSVGGGIRADGDLDATISGSVGGGLRGGGVLTAIVSGSVGGDLEGLGTGDHTVTIPADGAVTGGVRAGGDLTIDVSGSVGGGVRADGVLTATVSGSVGGDVEGLGTGDHTVMIPAGVTVAGSVRAGGNLTADVSGRVEGDVQASGVLTLTAPAGSVIAGTAGGLSGAFTVTGSIGRLLYGSAGTATVPSGRALAGVEVEGGGRESVRGEAGDLSVEIIGEATGDVVSAAGALDLDVSGTLTGAARGMGAGSVRADVSGTMTGDIESMGDLDAAIAGELTGDVRAEGSLTADVSGTMTGDIRSMGDLTATVSGMVDGDIDGLGAGDHTVTISAGGVVTGTVHLAASTVRVDGTAGAVSLARGGTLTIGPNGRILGIGGVAVRHGGGALTVTIEAAPDERPEESVARVEGTVPPGADDLLTLNLVSTDGLILELNLDVDGRITSGPPPRALVYEALPSVLLGMSRPLSHAERMGAPRSPRGVWARAEGARGAWKAGVSTTGVEYRLKRRGVRAGADLRAGSNFLFGFSVHRVRGEADVDEGGEVEVAGSGLGLHAAWGLGAGFYVDAQVEATSYEADLESARRGELRKGAKALGLAFGAELGRRVRASGLVFAPRVRLVRASVSMSGFTDATGSSVSVEDAGSFTGAAGVGVERRTRTGRLFASADFEREFREETRVRLDRETLAAKASASRVRLRAGGFHEWDGGRYAAGGALDFSAAGESYEVGGSVNFRVRF